MIYGYARVSTQGQARDGGSLFDQRQELLDAGATKVVEEAFTGTTMNRPKFENLLDTLNPGDTLIVTKLDRFSRSASKGIAMMDKLLDRDIKVHILNMGLMDNSPTGKLIRNIMFAFAEFERDTIFSRTQMGKRVKQETDPNWREGRRRKNISNLSEYQEQVVTGQLTVRDACKMLNISERTWYNRINEKKAK